jgi:hypothetical protein
MGSTLSRRGVVLRKVNMNITSMRIRFLEGGLASGKLALSLELGRGGFKVSPSALVELTLKQIIVGSVKSRLVLLTGDTTSPENLDAESFVLALGAHGITPVLEVPGYELPPWGALIPTRIVHLTEDPWLGFSASEINYLMSSPTRTPKLDPSLHAGASFVLTPRAHIKGAEILAFLATSPFPWRLASRPVSLPYVDLTPLLRGIEEGASPDHDPDEEDKE